MIGIMGILDLISGALWLRSVQEDNWHQKTQYRVDQVLNHNFLVFLGWNIAWLGLFFTGFFLIFTITSTDEYLGYPLKAGQQR